MGGTRAATRPGLSPRPCMLDTSEETRRVVTSVLPIHASPRCRQGQGAAHGYLDNLCEPTLM